MKIMKISNNISAMFAALILTMLFGAASITAQTTAFTYQGRFTDTTASQPTNGTYTMTFRLFDAETGGTPIGADINSMVSVVNGIFTVKLNFGAAAFATAGARYLEIQVGNTILTTRQEITATPFANRAVNAASADALSANCVGCVSNQQINSIDGTKITGSVANAGNAAQLGGTAASNFVQTNSTAFVRNQTTTQTATDFNISGTGAASVFNAATQYNIGGNRILGVVGPRNLFIGIDAGKSSAGDYNSFVGTTAGYYNTTGSGNSFFGSGAGTSNTTGFSNSFLARDSGITSTTGENNSFFGAGAGLTNRTGSNNTLLGTLADVGSISLNYATAVGAGVTVNSRNTVVLGRAADDVRIPGDLIVGGALSATLGQSAATVYGTAALTVTRTNSIYTLVPGLTRTIAVPANADVFISTDGGIQTLSETADGVSIVDVAIFIDGNIISARQHDISNVNVSRTGTNWSLSGARTLSAGSHTIEVRARSSDESFLSNATVSGGGDGNNQLRGQLTVTVIKR